MTFRDYCHALSVIHLLLAHRVASLFFCEQFFVDIRERSPYNFTVNDTALPGDLIHRFPHPPTGPQHTLLLTSPDAALVAFDFSVFGLVVQASLRPRNGEVLEVNGTCVSIIQPIVVTYEVPVTFYVTVHDVNDPPVFVNLPATLNVFENASVSSVLFTIRTDAGFDLSPDFRKHMLSIEGVTALETSRPSPGRTFYTDDTGAVHLLQPLDYEMGPRFYKLKILAQDAGDPPMRNASFLTIHVHDVDDMAPKFSSATYIAEIIGEKPLQGREECFNATPVVKAEDQDRKVKSEVIYSIVQGEPGARYYWSQFFRLDTRLGLLCQKQMVQRLLRDEDTGRDVFYNFTFTIKAHQADNPAKHDTARLYVHVVDANSFSPTFEKRLYRASLPEFPVTPEGALVTRVTAVDKDHGLNAAFRYELLQNPHNAFSVDAYGRVTVSRPQAIDRERHSSMTIKVRAQETDSVDRRYGDARIVLIIDDVNDHAPLFPEVEYRYVIKDTLPTGRAVHEVDEAPIANDLDPGDNGEVTYKITGVWRLGGQTLFSDLGRFAVDTNTGVIRLAGSLRDLRRRRDYPVFHLMVTATDRAKEAEKLSSSINVYVRVVHANDFAPRFAIEQQDGASIDALHADRNQFSAPEDAPIGTVVVKLPASDADGDPDVFLSYKVISEDGEEDETFYITDKGWLTLRKQLDRERKESYDLTVEVTDGLHNVSTNVSVQIGDVNDNAPAFDQSEYEFYIKEEPDLGIVVGKVTATDPDLGEAGKVTYMVKFGKGAEDFSIRPDGTLLVWRDSYLLDREQNARIDLKIVAIDLGEPQLQSTTEVTIYLHDVNDNAPQFEAPFYTGSAEEDDKNPRAQLVVMEVPIRSIDGDAEKMNRDVRYSLSGAGSDTFVINPITGVMATKAKGAIDCETQCSYKFQVVVTDQAGMGLSSSVDLTINVKDTNDNSPEFGSPKTFDLDGTAKIGDRVGNIEAADGDVTEPNNRLIYILKGGGFGKFAVGFDTGDIVVSDGLDREPFLPEYQLQVQALDGGTPRLVNDTLVTITVPVNRPPVINTTSLSMRVDEEVANGTLVGRILVSDPDNMLENQIGRLASRVNGRRQEHRFYTLDMTVPFTVSRDTGEVFTSGHLDREKDEQFRFLMFVEDTGHPPMTSNATVTIWVNDVNDHAPRFYLSHYHGAVVEDDVIAPGSHLVNLNVNLTAEDWDATAENRGVKLSLVGPQATWFHLRREGSLAVSTYGRGRIDRETHSVIHLKVRATDREGKGQTTDVDLTIRVLDVNDNAPKFRVVPHEILVHENVQVGETVGRLLAEDADSSAPNNDVLYTLESDTYGKFRVDLRTGGITVLRGLFFQPRQPTYILRVAVTDMGSPPLTAETTVTVNVNKADFNDYKPEILGETVFYVQEEVEEGTLVGHLEAVDEDLQGAQGSIQLTIVSDVPVPFSIDSDTGELYTAGRVDYDAGQRAYTFSVLARDAGDPPKEARSYVGVILEDTNDNPPKFAQAVYRHRITTHFPAGTVVATPFAYDDVDSLPGRYSYTLEGAGNYFTISASDGVVRTTEALSGLTETVMECSVLARDRDNPRLVAVAQLVVDVDVGEELPQC